MSPSSNTTAAAIGTRSGDRAASEQGDARPAVDAGRDDAKDTGDDSPVEHVEVAIVGAGLSGICMAALMADLRPDDRVVVLEARDRLGGTWDLFRYPGIRSDSDMATLGYSFRPWRGAAIADGPSIREYIRETAVEHGILDRVRVRRRVTRASWDGTTARWTLQVEHTADGRVEELTASWLYLATGYYHDSHGHSPTWPGMDDFAGPIVHPQQWPEGERFAGRRIAVIGSGATAVTLVPELARDAAHVTMVQRTPTYVLSLPRQDPIAERLFRVLPAQVAHTLVRWKNILLSMALYQFSKWRPDRMRRFLADLARKEVGDDVDVATHFDPPYDPWDQRLCIAPDNDLFHALRDGDASVVTGTIQRFTEHGLQLADGQQVEADVVVTATGLSLRIFGDMAVDVDGVPVDPADTTTYKGAMFSDLPNLSHAFGYTSASWTLKCELIARWTIRVLDHLDEHGQRMAIPRLPANQRIQALVDLSSGYIRRSLDRIPSQGSTPPWVAHQNYLRDLQEFRWSSVDTSPDLELR